MMEPGADVVVVAVFDASAGYSVDKAVNHR
jgi:hypothetical protein